MLSEECECLKMRVSEIRVNQGLGVIQNIYSIAQTRNWSSTKVHLL